MISGIKIYDGNGNLKEEIPADKAAKLYNDQNKEAWDLSPTERKRWNSLVTEDAIPYERKGIRPWIKRTHKITKRFKLNCVVCDKEMVKASPRALVCNETCRNIRNRVDWSPNS